MSADTASFGRGEIAQGELPFPTHPWVWPAAWAAVLLAHLALIWGSTYPPLVDYPNHLARAFIQGRYSESPWFQSAFVLDLNPIPYLGADLPLVLLSRWLDARDAGRVVLTAAFLLFALGCARLGRALHGRASWGSLSAVFSFLGPVLLFGFLNYLIGLGLFLCTAALFLESAGRRLRASRLLLLALGATLCYLSHLAAFVLLGLFVAALLGERFLLRAPLAYQSRLILPLLPGLVLYSAVMATQRPQSVLRWGTPSSKLLGLSWLGGTGTPALDLLVAGLIALTLILARRRGDLAMSGLGLGLSALCLGLYVVFPEWLYGWAMDRRFLLPALTLLLLSLDPRRPDRWKTLALGVVLGLLARPLVLGASWSRASETIAEQVELLRALPRHSRVFPLVSENVPGMPYYDRLGMRHVGHYATLERDAILPTLFAGRGSFSSSWLFPLRWRTAPPVGEVPPQQVLVQDVPWDLIFRHDFVYAWGVRPSYESVLRRRCRVLALRGRGTLFGPCPVRPE